MGVYIKGVSADYIEGVFIYARIGARDNTIGKGIEAIQLPDHGDLIDRDVVSDALDLMAVHGRLQDAFDMVMSCEAVIPAERSESDEH